jgi:mannosyl-oligosaccharide alpha-1,2-mannosidase
MYEKALAAMKSNIFFRPMVKDGADILFAGNVDNTFNAPPSTLVTVAEAQHLGCFAGGMVGVGARAFGSEADVDVARRLMEGCLWVYEKARGGIMPEILEMVGCESEKGCAWDETRWVAAMNRTHRTGDLEKAEELQKEMGLPHGVIRARDKRYILRYALLSRFLLLGF